VNVLEVLVLVLCTIKYNNNQIFKIMKNKVLVTGATGSIGNYAVKRLLELNVPVRAMVHQLDSRSDALIAQGVEVVVGDLQDFASVSAALKDIPSALFLYPVAEGLLRATALFAHAALDQNVKLIVNISQRTAVQKALSHSAHEHWLAEQFLDAFGVPVTHLQPTLFMDWLTYFAQEIKENNRYISPFGDTKFGIISPEDIGRVAAVVLSNPEDHIGKAYRIYGPEELSGNDVAAVLTDVLKREIAYAPIDPETFGGILTSFNQPPYQVKHIIAIGHMFPSGEFKGMNENVEQLTGTKPVSVKEFIHKNINLFK
jgi:uncharacterized protein YbjT (DUF2867 family)